MSITNYNLRNQLRNTLTNIQKRVQAGSAVSAENTSSESKTITYQATFDFKMNLNKSNSRTEAAENQENTPAAAIIQDLSKTLGVALAAQKGEDTLAAAILNAGNSQQTNETQQTAETEPKSADTSLKDDVESMFGKLFDLSFAVKGSTSTAKPKLNLHLSSLANGLDNLLNSDNKMEKEFAQIIKDLVGKLDSAGLNDSEVLTSAISAMFVMIQQESTPFLSKAINSNIITSDQLLALDKNGDGSFLDELKSSLEDDNFITKLQKNINMKSTLKEAKSIAGDDDKLNVSEIAQNFGKSEIADLFKTADGKVDRALIIALGGEYDKNGNYSLLPINVFRLDVDKDGKLTKEDLAKFKETDTYKKAQYEMVMKEMEKANDSNNNFDNKFCLADITKFMANNKNVSAEQKDFFSPITNIADKNLQSYIMKSISSAGTITIKEFTDVIDQDGDGIVTKEELQKYVDFVSQCYNAEKSSGRTGIMQRRKSAADGTLTKDEARKMEPFKSNPDLLVHFSTSKITVQCLWHYVKNNGLV